MAEDFQLRLSPSQVSTYLRCPRQWYYRYVEKLKEPPSGALSLGRSAHVALDHNYSQKVQTGADRPVDEVVEVFREDFHAREKEVAWKEGETPEKVGKEGASCVRTYQEKVAPKVQPILVEKFWTVDFENVPGLTMAGRIDLVDSNHFLRDSKFKSRKPNPNEAHRSYQLTYYGVGHRKLTGKLPEAYQLDVVTRTKVPGIFPIKTSRSEADISRALRLVVLIMRAIKTGLFPPADPDSWICSEKWCGYWHRCPFGGGK